MRFKAILISGILILLSAICAGVYFGVNADMSYDDPTVNLNSIKTTGQLGVLSAHVNILNSLMFGSPADTDYMGLFSQEATAVYYVDLEQAEIYEGINEKGNSIAFVKLPEPSVALYVDETRTEKIAEYQVNSNWTGSAEAGYRAYFEQADAGYEEMLDSLQESDGLMLEAKSSAIQRVTELLKALSVEDKEFEVYFSSANGGFY